MLECKRKGNNVPRNRRYDDADRSPYTFLFFLGDCDLVGTHRAFRFTSYVVKINVNKIVNDFTVNSIIIILNDFNLLYSQWAWWWDGVDEE